MADGDDLPDHDYESIYGRAAMHARFIARLDAVIARIAARAARLERLDAAWPQREGEERET